MACARCGHEAWRLIAEGEDYEYRTRPGPFKMVECSRCQHVYLHPLPAIDDIPVMYPSTYYTTNAASPARPSELILAVQTKLGVGRIRQFMGDLPVKSLVDLGCGNAARLIKLSETVNGTAELVGVDLHHDTLTIAAARKAGITLVVGNVETDLSALRDGGYDFILMTQMIEHFLDPWAVLRHVHQKLSRHGRLLIETPNVGGLDYYLFKHKYWGHWHFPRHLHLFTRKSLAQVVSQAGYGVVEQGYLPSPGPWILSLRNRLGLNSIARTRGTLKSLMEFISFRNLPVVTFFTALDSVTMRMGVPTSMQFLVAEKR